MDTQNTQNSNLDTIMRRIRALLTLANDTGATPDEAGAATAKANALMLKYNLQLAEVQAATGAKSDYQNEAVTLLVKSGQYVRVHRQLLNILARANFCRVLNVNGTDRCQIIGEAHNIALVGDLYRFLGIELGRMAEAALRERRALGYRVYNAVGWKRDFMIGASDVISTRLRAERRQAERDAATGEQVMALVVVKDGELADAVKHYYPHTTSGRPLAYHAGSAYESGQAAGSQVELRPTKKIEGCA